MKGAALTVPLSMTSSSDRLLDESPVSSDDGAELGSERLADLAKAGSAEAFESLVNRHAARIFNFLCHRVGNVHDAEDLTQETFLQAYQSIHRFDSTASFVTWLFTIARRTAASHFRAARPTEMIESDTRSNLADPADALERKDERSSVWALARKLKPNQYEALWLRYGEGFSVTETARIMRTNSIYVKVLLHRARRGLAENLSRASGRNHGRSI